MDGDRIAAAARAAKRRLAGMTGRLEAPQARVRRRGDLDQQLEVPKMWARVAKTVPPPKPDRLWKRPMMMMRRLPHGSGPIQTIPKRQRHHVRPRH
jgi:hypothetical protein